MNALEINPLDANFIFQIGQPILAILIGLTLIIGGIGFFARTFQHTRLDIEMSRWLSRLMATLLYTILIWLGLSMMISYFSTSIIDVINGSLILAAVVISLVKRAYQEQDSANRYIAIGFALIGVFLLWHFIYNSVIAARVANIDSALGDMFRPVFFTDLFRAWRLGM